MATNGTIHIHQVMATDTVRIEWTRGNGSRRCWLDLPGHVTMFFGGFADDAEANLLGFLDQMHAIRNALLQDMADRAEVTSDATCDHGEISPYVCAECQTPDPKTDPDGYLDWSQEDQVTS